MYFRIFLLLLLTQAASAKEPEITIYNLPEPRHATNQAAMDRALRRAKINSDRLKSLRGPTTQAMPLPHTVELKWPIREAIAVTDPSVQTLSNYLDQDPSQGGILDWNCGDRTYDGHNGVDVGMAPFGWYKMRNDHGIVIAAAPGTILEIVNDQPEDSCEANTNSGDNNVIIIEHEDDSWGIYAHMRTGSITNKKVGDTVSFGEYLGVIGSAGISTGPHLHFGVGFLEQEGNLLRFVEQDPWEGACNDINADGWWEQQPPYFQPLLMSVSTHDAAPVFPPCPQTETPNYGNSFSAGDPIIFSATIRDRLVGQQADFSIKMPNGNQLFGLSIVDDENDAPGGQFLSIPTDLPGNAMSGEWTLEVTFEGETLVHSFWVDSAPDPAPTMPPSNNAYNGLWYDPTLDGEGYNVITAIPGTVIFFYGSDSDDQRLWLISELITEFLSDGGELTVVMYESTGGTHESPIGSARGLSVWGELKLTFDDCNNGTAVLRGVDGEKISQVVKLAGVPGTSCVGEPVTDSGYSGLWFDTSLEGEGFNLIVTPFGVVIFYYGFDTDGNRLWFIAGPINQTLQTGQQVSTDLLKATTGTFDSPVPSDQALETWGDLTIDVINCNELDLTMDTKEGDKISATVRLASVVGINCVD